jgi:hypothetical protein
VEAYPESHTEKCTIVLICFSPILTGLGLGEGEGRLDKSVNSAIVYTVTSMLPAIVYFCALERRLVRIWHSLIESVITFPDMAGSTWK